MIRGAGAEASDRAARHRIDAVVRLPGGAWITVVARAEDRPNSPLRRQVEGQSDFGCKKRVLAERRE